MRAGWWNAVIVFVAVLFSSGPRAFAAADETLKKAKSLYDNGVTDYNLGHYEEALVSFEQAYRIRHDPAFLFNIGQCQRQLHKYEDAERSYRAYMRESVDLPQTTRDQVQKLIAEMNKAVEDARSKQPPIGAQPPTEPRQQPAIAPQATSAPPPRVGAVTPSDDRGGRKKMTAGLAVAGFGVAAIAAGGGFYAVASSANDQLNHPSNGVYSQSAEDGRDTFQSLDIAAFIVGGVAIVTGATVAVLGWRQRHRMTFTQMASCSRIGTAFTLSF